MWSSLVGGRIKRNLQEAQKAARALRPGVLREWWSLVRTADSREGRELPGLDPGFRSLIYFIFLAERNLALTICFCPLGTAAHAGPGR